MWHLSLCSENCFLINYAHAGFKSSVDIIWIKRYNVIVVMKALITITQFGIDMIVPIFLCSMLGRWLDGRFGTSWIFIVLFFVGAAAGASNVYRLARRLMKESGDVRNRDRADNDTGKDPADDGD